MEVLPPEPRAAQVLYRVKVGITGLAMVLVLIVLASVLLRSVGRERPGSGVARVALADNAAAANGADTESEPLAEIGVAPGNTTATARDR